jgi:DNA polymerase-2
VLGLYCQQHGQLMRLETALNRAGVDVFEADVRPPERYLMERFITAPVLFSGSADATASARRPTETRPDYRPTCWSRWTSKPPPGELYSIALEGCGQRQVYMLGAQRRCEQVDFDLEYCDSPPAEKLNDWFARHDPDAIIGWNVVQFDLRVLHEHASALGVPLKLGRGGEEMQWREHGSRSHYFASAAGG